VAVPAARDPRIDDYLDHACAPLVGVVPFEKREELRREWRAHLEALAEARAELDGAPADAVAAALRQFGDPVRLGRQWARAWRRGDTGRLWPAVRTAACVFAPASLACWLLGQFPQFGGLWLYALGVPLAAGMLAGYLSRGRRAFGACLSVAAVSLVSYLAHWTLGTDDALVFSRSYQALLVLLALQLIWIPVGGIGAGIGGWLRDRADEAPRRWTPE
jgi:hypothetical protein